MKFEEIKRCSKCIMPQTVDGIEFNEDGICNICTSFKKNFEEKTLKKEAELINLLEKFKGQGQYDCLVPFSGGKDSVYTLYLCKKFGLKPLAYNFNNHFHTEIGERNLHQILDKLGVDLIQFTPNWETAKKLCQKGVKKYGDFCWFCNCGIYASSINRAIIEKIPLIIYGESSLSDQTGMSASEIIEKVYKDNCQHGITEVEYLDNNLSQKDLQPYLLPDMNLIKNISIVHLADYIKWNKFEILEFIKKEFDWQEADPNDKNFNSKTEHIDCKYAIIKEHMKFLKRGYAVNTSTASEKIRLGEITRDQALKEINKDDLIPKNLDDFLRDMELTKEEFLTIMLTHKKY